VQNCSPQMAHSVQRKSPPASCFWLSRRPLEAARRPRVADRAAINRRRQFTNGKLLRSCHAFLVLLRTAHAGGRRSRKNRARASFGCRGSGQLRCRLRSWRPWLTSRPYVRVAQAAVVDGGVSPWARNAFLANAPTTLSGGPSDDKISLKDVRASGTATLSGNWRELPAAGKMLAKPAV
jgi:hypothetical protein